MRNNYKQFGKIFLSQITKSTALSGLGKFAQKCDGQKNSKMMAVTTITSLELLLNSKRIKYFDIQESGNATQALCAMKLHRGMYVILEILVTYVNVNIWCK